MLNAEWGEAQRRFASFSIQHSTFSILLMLNHKSQRSLVSLDEINTVFVSRRVDAEFAAVGLEFIHLLAEGVIDAHHAEVFAAEGHEVVGWIREERDLNSSFFYAGFTIMLLVAFTFHSVDDEIKRGRINVAVGEGVVGTNEHDGGVVAHRNVLGDVVAATVTADGGILYIELVHPSLALVVMAVG